MKNMPLVFCGIFFSLAVAWVGLIMSSQIQYGDLKITTETLDPDTKEPIAGDPYFPEETPGLAKEGKQVYISMGCVYCHTQQVRRKGFGADYERGWGKRQTVARDYILQNDVLLGTYRIGPDLMNVGERVDKDSGEKWLHQKLYDPQISAAGSNMPPYQFLYRKQLIGVDGASDNALALPANLEPEPGYEIVPTKRAEALVAYLLSLKLNYDLPEAKRE